VRACVRMCGVRVLMVKHASAHRCQPTDNCVNKGESWAKSATNQWISCSAHGTHHNPRY
jgi:hypothetical protein